MTFDDHDNSGTSQLYIRTDNGFECKDISENMQQTNHDKLQETSVVYTFCATKLQVIIVLLIVYLFVFLCKKKKVGIGIVIYSSLASTKS